MSLGESRGERLAPGQCRQADAFPHPPSPSLPVCHCAAATPPGVADPATATAYAAAASSLAAALAADADGAAAATNAPLPPTHVVVPPLYRRTAVVDAPVAAAGYTVIDPEPSAEDAAAARDAAAATAREAADLAREAALACAAAGREYVPPPGVEVEGRVEVEVSFGGGEFGHFRLSSQPPLTFPPTPPQSIDAAAIDAAANAATASIDARKAAEAKLARQPRVLLAPSDARAAASARARVHVMWPDDGVWWPARIQPGAMPDAPVTIMYDTGEEEPGADLAGLAARGEIAWEGQTRAAALAKYYQSVDGGGGDGGDGGAPTPRAPARATTPTTHSLAPLPPLATCRVTVATMASLGTRVAGTVVRVRLADGAEVDGVVVGGGGTHVRVRAGDGRVVTLTAERDGIDYTVVVAPVR